MSIYPFISDSILSALNISKKQLKGHILINTVLLNEVIVQSDNKQIYHKQIRYNNMLVIIDCF